MRGPISCVDTTKLRQYGFKGLHRTDRGVEGGIDSAVSPAVNPWANPRANPWANPWANPTVNPTVNPGVNRTYPLRLMSNSKTCNLQPVTRNCNPPPQSFCKPAAISSQR
jgi:hypothetical protein